MAHAFSNGKSGQNPTRKSDDGLAESGIEIETVHFDPNKIAEYMRLAAEAEEEEQKKRSFLPASAPKSPPNGWSSASSSSNVIPKYDGKVLLNTKRPRFNYTLTKVPKAEPPKNAPAVIILDNKAIDGSFPINRVSLKRKLTDVDGTLKSIYVADNEEQAKKPAKPIGFRCAWQGCGYVNGTEGNTIRHIRKLHFEGSETAGTSTVYDNKVICSFVSPIYEKE